ncbi:heterokaryon incompatibility protein-domain-containing protein [Cladorrhinum samala]|uniref:Heterokaryon incompatibility protein-domain-containing protein n=1 Tax=Cladorrhinum samala TaxID=585594 RepID=A0AAV9HC06_9PEZI|nr:heterokaryon incompatibility protein-domain-containing protein [Cladorrhinum samala]
MDSTEGLYTYAPLPSDHIRLLNLHPSPDPSAPLQGDLLTLPLFPSPSAQAAPFSALSYVWGPTLPSPSSNQNLTTPTGVIRLTPSLFSFLNRLRDTSSESLLLWADAICINQLDPYEKEAQVSLMADIYRSATQVLADLGEETDGTAVALAAIAEYTRAGVRRGITAKGFGKLLSPQDTARFLDLPLPAEDDVETEEETNRAMNPSAEVTEAVIRFFERPWFTRVWVVQEFVLARAVQMFVGKTKVSWQQLLGSGILFNGMPMLVQESVSFTMREIWGMMSFLCMAYIRRIRTLNSTEDGREFVSHLASLSDGRLLQFYQDPGLASLLHYLRMCRATLGRDRYFALLRLASDVTDEDWAELRPDYISTDDAIVRRYARVLIRKKGAAEMFMRAGLWRGTNTSNPELPSWFEDATHEYDQAIMDLTVEESIHKAAGDSEFVVGTDAEIPDVIWVKGHRLDTLREVCPAYALPKENTSSTMLEELQQVLFGYVRKAVETLLKFSEDENEPLRPGPYLTGEELADAAALTVCAYRGVDALSREALFKGFWFMCLAVMGLGADWNNHQGSFRYQWSDEMEGEIGDSIEYYCNELGVVVNGNLLPAVTDKGYFASGPGACEGDEVWIIQGCRIPILLRPNNEPEYGGRYRLVGTCYVHGVMSGEALQHPDFEWRDVSLC